MCYLQARNDLIRAGDGNLLREDTTVIFKKVPADVCDNCGEYYLSEEVTDNLLNRAESAVKNGAEVEICSLMSIQFIPFVHLRHLFKH